MATLYAGSTHVDITPELGHDLAGWIDVRPATRKATPILARALVLVMEQSRVAIINCDLLWIGADLLKRIEVAIQEDCSIPPQNIFILPTHNHYGPNVTGSYAGDAKLSDQETAYSDALVGRLADAARMAMENMKPARLRIGYGDETVYSHNSRFWRKDGTINWLGKRDLDFAKDSGPKDTQLGVLHICDEQDTPIATLFNFACHANCAEKDGFTAISWDWPGYTSQAVNQALGGEALFLVGACGNIHPIREGAAKEMGESIAGIVIDAVKSSKTIEPGSLRVQRKEISVPGRDFRSFDAGQIESICSQMPDEAMRTRLQSIFMGVLDHLQKSEIPDYAAQLRVVALGDLALTFIPGEYFTEFGLEIKKRSPFAHTFVIESLGECLGYIPTQKAYQEGGYQPAVGSRLAPGGGEYMMEQSLALLKEIHK